MQDCILHLDLVVTSGLWLEPYTMNPIVGIASLSSKVGFCQTHESWILATQYSRSHGRFQETSSSAPERLPVFRSAQRKAEGLEPRHCGRRRQP
jgi:hypothetical protein